MINAFSDGGVKGNKLAWAFAIEHDGHYQAESGSFQDRIPTNSPLFKYFKKIILPTSQSWFAEYMATLHALESIAVNKNINT